MTKSSDLKFFNIHMAHKSTIIISIFKCSITPFSNY